MWNAIVQYVCFVVFQLVFFFLIFFVVFVVLALYFRWWSSVCGLSKPCFFFLARYYPEGVDAIKKRSRRVNVSVFSIFDRGKDGGCISLLQCDVAGFCRGWHDAMPVAACD